MFDENELEAAGKFFAIVGPSVSEADVDTIFPGAFPGREDLVQFYIWHNGGSRTPQGCVIHCGKPEHKVARDHLDKMIVEGFMSVSLDPADRMLPFRPIIGHLTTMRGIYAQVPEMEGFLRQNIPFAFDHSGENICVNLSNGSVCYMDYTEYRKRAIEIAPSFRDFVLEYWVNAEHLLEA
jgi:hypothetical protein